MSSIISQETAKPILVLTSVAAEVVTAAHFIRHSGACCGVRGSRARGVTVADAMTGYSVAVVVDGTALVVSGEEIEAGDAVTMDEYGRAVKVLAGEYVNGIALIGQPITGKLVEVQLFTDHIGFAE